MKHNFNPKQHVTDGEKASKQTDRYNLISCGSTGLILVGCSERAAGAGSPGGGDLAGIRQCVNPEHRAPSPT